MFVWGDASNQQVHLTMAQAGELAAAMAQAQVNRNDEIYQRQREMKDQLSLLSTLDEVRALTLGG
ncbi:phage tail protein [Salmonella enterica subsp. enterica serovar Enteritidis]|nr:phage tail protein [Salmonella enterica subsp. enterica serovar Enteritidis]